MNQILLDEESDCFINTFAFGLPYKKKSFSANIGKIYRDEINNSNIKLLHNTIENDDAIDLMYLNKKSNPPSYLTYKDDDLNKENFPPIKIENVKKNSLGQKALVQKANNFNNFINITNEHSFTEIILMSIKGKNQIAQMEKEKRKQNKILMLKKEQRERKKQYNLLNNYKNTNITYNYTHNVEMKHY